MAHLYAHEGDTVTIMGREFKVVIAGDEYAHNEPGNYALVPEGCRGCGRANDDGWGGFCARCIERAMHGVVLLEALEHVIEHDDRIRAVIEMDQEERNNAAQSSTQYIDLLSGGWDAVAGYDVAQIDGMISEFGQMIHAYIIERMNT